MSRDPFDPDSVGRAIPAGDLAALRRAEPRRRLPRPGKGEQYLGGPIPLGWLSRAASLPGRALHLGAALWFAAVRSKGKNPSVVLTDALADRFGLKARTTRSRALAVLERAGLVAVENRVGRSPVVTILPGDRPAAELDNQGRARDN
jgi:hypothetical protein